jgi:hypothetical protein
VLPWVFPMRFLLSAAISLPVPALIVFCGVVILEQGLALGAMRIPDESMERLALVALACWVAAGAYVFRSRAPFNYTKSVMVFALGSTLAGAAGRYFLNDTRWDEAFAVGIMLVMVGAFVSLPADVIAWRRRPREDDRSAETSIRRPSLFQGPSGLATQSRQPARR